MSDESIPTELKDKKLGAKAASKWSQIIAAVWIGGWSGYSFMNGSCVPVTDIIYSAIAIMAVFSPVYISIILDKIKDIKFGGK